MFSVKGSKSGLLDRFGGPAVRTLACLAVAACATAAKAQGNGCGPQILSVEFEGSIAASVFVPNGFPQCGGGRAFARTGTLNELASASCDGASADANVTAQVSTTSVSVSMSATADASNNTASARVVVGVAISVVSPVRARIDLAGRSASNRQGDLQVQDLTAGPFIIPAGFEGPIGGSIGCFAEVNGFTPDRVETGPCTLTITITPLDPVETTFAWIGSSGDPFSDTQNWDPNCDAPDAEDTAIFGPVTDSSGNSVNSYAVSTASETVKRIIIDAATLDLNGSLEASETSSVEPSLTIVRAGRLILDSGARFSGVNGSIGFDPRVADKALMQVAGSGSDAEFSGRLIVGEFSEAEVFVREGGTMSCEQGIIGDIADGTMAVTGSGSRWDLDSLTIGATSANGTLEVNDAGRVEVVDTLAVGDLSTGTLRITGGGQVRAEQVKIGVQANGVNTGDGTVEVRGSDGNQASLLDVSDLLRVGVNGNAVLEISDGGTVRAGDLEFPLGVPTQPVLTVQGRDSS